MPTINGLSITPKAIENCYLTYYPDTYKKIADANLFHYLHIWGVRGSSCDTSLPDDILGGLRINNFNFTEVITSKASTEPSPKYLIDLHDAEARAKGGSAFVMEGQYVFRYMGSNNGVFRPLPSFCPIQPVKVYRWTPSPSQIAEWKGGKGTPLSAHFEQDVKDGRVAISTSSDTCIHRTWGKEKLWNDSAGCQVITDDDTLRTLGQWASDHIKKQYGNAFTYTLFTKEQFLNANGEKVKSATPLKSGTTTPTEQPSLISTILNNLFSLR